MICLYSFNIFVSFFYEVSNHILKLSFWDSFVVKISIMLHKNFFTWNKKKKNNLFIPYNILVQIFLWKKERISVWSLEKHQMKVDLKMLPKSQVATIKLYIGKIRHTQTHLCLWQHIYEGMKNSAKKITSPFFCI